MLPQSIGLLLALIAIVVSPGCARAPLYRTQSYVFGTLVEVSIWGEEETRARAVIARVLQEFDRLHRELHAWQPSDLTRLNAAFARGSGKVSISAEMAEIIQDATRWAEASGELFNPAIGKLVALWGFHADEFKPVRPDPAEIARLVAARPRMTDVEIDGSTAFSRNPAVQLDFGGYAKGYALDLAAGLLRAEGIKDALINIGGNILALGEHGNRPWRVGVQHPRKAVPIVTLDLYDGEAIGTSGDYQRYFELDGVRYCHIIDPRNGRPVQGVQAVTVLVKGGIHPGALSDAGTKPLFIAGRDGWRAAARRIGIDLAMLIDDHGEVYLTTRLAKRVKPWDSSTVLHEVP
jgi:FAD:protein FMN transferase